MATTGTTLFQKFNKDSLKRVTATFCEEMPKYYKSLIDSVLGGCLVYTSTILVLMILATAIYAACFPMYGQSIPWRMIFRLIPFIAFLAVALFVKHHLLGSHLQAWAHWLLFFAIVWAGWSSLAWFHNPMHDIALLFDSHGRWGCRGTSYVLCDTTAPWFLFAPVTVGAFLHWMQKRRESQNTNLEPISGSQ